MADERNPLTGDTSTRAAELQRQIDARRRSISQTLGEMKSTMTHEVDRVKSQASSRLDLRQNMHRYPMALAIGALALGFFAGRGVGRTAITRSSNYDYDIDFPCGVRSEHGDVGMSSHHSRSLISPDIRDRVSTRVEGALSEVADTFLSELVRVGRDILVPRLMGALSEKIDDKIQVHRSDYVPHNEQNYVGGTMRDTGNPRNF